MNSRYKFRVWNEDGKTYMNADDLWLTSDGGVYESPYPIPVMECTTIEQCTGVKDHTGKLIFEGDVVRMYIPCEDKHRICVVEYQIDEDDTAQWLCRYLDGKRKHNTFGSTIEITAEYLSGSYCEIIGNIHEYSADA